MLKSTSRRSFLLLPFMGTATAAYARFVEPGWLERTDRTCIVPNLARPLSLVHLSDLHASHDVPASVIEHAIGMAIDARPDLICVTGDFVTSAKGFDARWYAGVLQRLVAAAPTFAVLGNHDGGMWAAAGGGFRTTAAVAGMLESNGVRLMHNRSCSIACNGAELQIVGLGDLWAGELDAREAFQAASRQAPTILLAHNPDSKTLVANYPWHLMLSGHTHGGQVVVPLVGFNVAPVWDHAYVAGMKPWRDRWIHISRGVGNIRGIRFNCRPEVTRILLTPPNPEPAITSAPVRGAALT